MNEALEAAIALASGPVRVVADLLDIVVVAWIFYRVLLLVRGTRAMQMAIGLALVFVVYQLARRIGLVTLYTLLDSFITYVVLLVVVLFQNDLRSALARVGARPFLRGTSQQRQREVAAIEEVVHAAQALAQKHIGALIVFERDAVLDEVLQPGTGQELDAAVSQELLYSLFVPTHQNPLHDGAAIIRDGRIWKAGAFLPLTANPKLDRTLGTRHRAAIGVSEETDAVAVIVSEERGTVSLCFNGNMARDLDPGSLRQALLGLFQAQPKKKKGEGSSRTLRPSMPPAERKSQPAEPAPVTPPAAKPEETVP